MTASATMNAMMIAARSIHFFSAMLLFGGLLFGLAAAKPIWRHADESARGWYRRALPGNMVCAGLVLVGSLISGVTWLVAEAAIMSGLPLGEAATSEVVRMVLSGTMFGKLWTLRFGLSVILGALLPAIGRSVPSPSRPILATLAVLVAGIYLATLAWSGHAAAAQGTGSYAQIAADVAHLLAAGAWIGALPPLAFVLYYEPSIETSARVVHRFSIVGMTSVGALIVSGLINSWYLVGDVPSLIGTDYGQLLLVKLTLFVSMIAFAATNRWSLTARLSVNDLRHNQARDALVRNALIELAIGMVVVAIVGALGVMVPAAHRTPSWPFAFTLSWAIAGQSFGLGAAVIIAGIVALAAAGFALRGIVSKRWWIAATGAMAFAAGTATCGSLLAVPAYPTSYALPPLPYTTGSIAHGAALYTQSCSMCHGALGRGDGPLALSLPVVPADLAGHGSSHRLGELYWWIAHGIPGTPMPAFAPRLSDAEVWDLAQLVRALSDAEAATTLTNHAQPWRYPIAAPDFTFEIAGRGQDSLRQPEANPVTLLVLYTPATSSPYLNALATQATAFKSIGVRVIAIPLTDSGGSPKPDLGTDSGIIFAMTRSDVIRAYLMFARRDVDPANVVPEQVAFLIDRQGYIRARWIGVEPQSGMQAADAFDQADVLRRERLRPPSPSAHAH